VIRKCNCSLLIYTTSLTRSNITHLTLVFLFSARRLVSHVLDVGYFLLQAVCRYLLDQKLCKQDAGLYTATTSH